jgi:hypothetical protein
MARLRRSKSKKQQAADLLTSYFKAKPAAKAAKGAGKAAKGTAVQVRKRGSRGKLLAGAGLAAAIVAAVKIVHGHGHGDPAAA